MKDDPARRPDAPDRSPDDPIDRARMSFGDHLEELRACLIRALVGIAVGAAIGLTFGKEILGILCYPLFVAQIANGLPPQAQVLAPTAAFVAYLKIGILSGLILAMPWVLYQIWTFVLSGLYSHERRFVRYLIPTSSGLFAVGVAFLYLVVLPVVLHFFIRFNMSFGIPEFDAIAEQETSEVRPDAHSTAALQGEFSHLPVVLKDPVDPQPGWTWVNSETRRLMVQTESEVLSLPLHVGKTPSAMQSQFAIDYYVSFVLVLALAFGIAFETPIVVFFLAWTGLVPTATMQQGRRYVLLGTVIAAAILTPPDIISQLLLAMPMYLLFEVGILAGANRRAETGHSRLIAKKRTRNGPVVGRSLTYAPNLRATVSSVQCATALEQCFRRVGSSPGTAPEHWQDRMLVAHSLDQA